MIRFAALAAASLFAVTPVLAADLPSPLASAVEDAAQYEDFRASFSLRATAPGENPLVLRYDAEADEWTTLEGDLSQLDGTARKAVEEMQDEMSEPGQLTYHEMAKGLSGATLSEETPEDYIYEVALSDSDDDIPDVIQAALDPNVFVSKKTGTVRQFSLRTNGTFKPAAVAEITTFIMEQDFTPLPDGPAVISRFHNHVAGEALFQKFDEQFTIEFFDFVPMN